MSHKHPYKYTNAAGKSYFLHETKAANGKTALFYFSKDVNPAAAIDSIPSGKEIVENKHGVPFLKGIK